MTLFFFIIHIFVLLWLLLGYINAIIKRNKQKIISEENFSEFTILIAARNEEKNLSALLQSLQKQKIDWAKGKIVLVLDRCNDNSLSIAKEFKQQMPYLTIIENSKNPGNISPKKAALIRGLQEITTPIVLQTDADVTLPPEWIKSHLELHSTENAAVIGLFNFHLPDNLWGKWLLGEKLWTFLISIGSFGWNLPFLAFGSNISFNTKKLNYSKQLENFLHSISGDDDLIIQTLKGSKQKAAF
ncbi:MAG: glycosyltransferase, partial [Calditrichia bacterium]|nr:glycosyltransferase [Calditrichia bacterium]